MASPESSKPDPKSPIVQESPVFTYLSNLSPLKLVDSRQPYADISCPTPEPVFTSPHFIHPRESSLMKRLSGAERFSSGHDGRATESFPQNIGMLPSAAQTVKPAPCVLKRLSEIDVSQDQPCNSPTCVDAFLSDPLEDCDISSGSPKHHVKGASGLPRDVQAKHTSIGTKEHSTSTGLPDLNLTQPTSLQLDLWSDSTRTKGSTIELLAKTKTCSSSKAVAGSSSGYGFQEDPVEAERYVIVNQVETESTVKMVDKVVEVNEASLDSVAANISVNAYSAVVPPPRKQLEWDSVAQNAPDHVNDKANDSALHSHEATRHVEIAQRNRSDCTPPPRSDTFQNIQEGVDRLDGTEAKSSASAENHIFYDQEDGIQHQRGMRKRLQFEAPEICRMSADYQNNSWIASNNGCSMESPVTSLHVEPVNASSKELITTSGDQQPAQSISGNSLGRFTCKINCSVQNTGSPPVSVPRTVGIGLHLNSIVGPININVNIHSPDDDLGGQGDDLLCGSNSQASQLPKNNLSSRSLLRCHSIKSSASSDNLLNYSATENGEEKQRNQQAPNPSYQSSFNAKPLQSKPIDCYTTPCNIKKRASENVSKTGSSHRSPRKKTKKAPENEGCKRCNCKRSKCLKLYCDCFAAGVFCSEVCACQECHNKPGHEDTVREMRRQIESRNPLAFAPKVVVRASNPSKATNNNNRVTPTSAIHKRGCNCKKSLCLKRYCECFQAGVGCSLGCRCEGCMNSFGRKYGDDDITGIESEKYVDIGLERGPSIGNVEGVAIKKGIVNDERCITRLSPLTPVYQSTNGNEVVRSQLPPKYYISPESGASVSPFCESPSSPMDSISSNAFAKEAEGSSQVTYTHGLGHSAVQMDFSPGWDGFPDICNFSPLVNSSPRATGSPSARESKTFHTKLFQGSGRLSMGSLHWRSSPITPLPQLGEHKSIMEPESHSGQHKNHEDDTPEILRESSSPIKVVKASSPNQKRVSPPYQHVQEMRSSSPSLRSGRKFILQSVPSFPPLTPYSKNTREHGT